MVMLIAILTFICISIAISWALGARAGISSGKETSVFVLMASWAAFFFGMFVSRL